MKSCQKAFSECKHPYAHVHDIAEHRIAFLNHYEEANNRVRRAAKEAKNKEKEQAKKEISELLNQPVDLDADSVLQDIGEKC